MTLIVSPSKHLLVAGLYYGAREHLVLKVSDVLEAVKMDERKDLSEFDKRPYCDG